MNKNKTVDLLPDNFGVRCLAFENYMMPKLKKKKLKDEDIEYCRRRIRSALNPKQLNGVVFELNEEYKLGLSIDDYKEFKGPYDIEEEKSQKKRRFILSEEELPQLIDHAIGSIKIKGSNLRYYGLYLIERVQKGNTETKKEVPALVLENGEIISSETQKEEYKFELLTRMSMKENRWSLSSIQEFSKNPKMEVSFLDVYMAFHSLYKEAMVFEAEEYYILNPVWDMLSYFWDLIDRSMIIKHEGGTGTAKSKGMKISAQLSFNGRKFLKPTPATFFRYRHNNKATIYIEEAERLFSANPNADDSQLVEYLNGGYERGNMVPRCNDKNINQIDEFDPFGFLRVGAIAQLKGALEKRSVTQTMIKAPKEDGRGDVEIEPEYSPKFMDARNLAYINGLKNHKKFTKALGVVKNDYGLANREWVLVKPLLAIAKCIDNSSGFEDIEKTLGNFLVRLFESGDEQYSEDTEEFKLATGLVNHFENKPGKEEIFLDYGRLKSLYYETFSEEYPPKITSQHLAYLMNKLGFKLCRGRDSTGSKRGYTLSREKCVTILDRNEIIPSKKQPKSVSEVSDCQKSKNNTIKYRKEEGLGSDNCSDNSSDNKIASDISDDTDTSDSDMGVGIE